MKRYILSICLLSSLSLQAQVYNDYVGGGHYEGITVTASHSSNNISPQKTLDGSGLDNNYIAAARFLGQASTSFSEDHVYQVMDIGFENWINTQFNEPTTYLTPQMWSIWQDVKEARAAIGEDTTDIFGPYSVHYNYTLWTNTLFHEDLLRHRIAQALSEILVISLNSDIGGWAEGLTSYYDMLLTHSFGNYKDLLLATTKHPMMGFYLSSLNNPKTDLVNNIRPDENFAREIMQLFTIGLNELNIDGTPKRDANGNLIPTYDNNDIKEMAKVFTGLGAGAILYPNEWPFVPIFGLGTWAIDKTVPMKMYNAEHEPGPKVLLNDVTINMPGNGMGEVNAAVDYLFNHPNVGPFIAYRLIQRLVTSNPSPQYVSDVAQAFNNDGTGVRGNMKAVIKAILLHPEARSKEYMDLPDGGMIKPPFIKYAQLIRNLDIEVPSGRYWNSGFNYLENTGHWPLAAPSVFNFYSPFNQPPGELTEKNLVGPELKIHNTSSALKTINQAHQWLYWGSIWWSWEGEDIDVDNYFVLDEYVDMAEDVEKLINIFDRKLVFGQLQESTRNQIRASANSIYWNWDEGWKLERVRFIIYAIWASPEFNTLK